MNGLYIKGKEKFLRGEISWITDDIKAAFVTAAYTPDLSFHEFLSTINVSQVVAISDSLTGKTATGAWAGCANIVWEAFTGATCKAFVLFKDTGTASTSPLIAYIDTGITNLPLDPANVQVTLVPDASTGIFRL